MLFAQESCLVNLRRGRSKEALEDAVVSVISGTHIPEQYKALIQKEMLRAGQIEYQMGNFDQSTDK